jgi:hypothetical protein
VFLTKWVEKCLRLSDFAKITWIIEGSEAFFSRKMGKDQLIQGWGIEGWGIDRFDLHHEETSGTHIGS